MKKQTAFTLIELLIALAVTSIIGVILVSVLTNNSAIFSDQNAKINQGLSLNNAVSHIEEGIKSASSVVAQYPTTGQPTYTTGTETVIIALPSLNAQGLVIESVYDYLVFTKDPNSPKIFRKLLFPNALSVRTAENEVLSTRLALLRFNYYDTANQLVSPVQATKVGYIINVADTIASQTKTSTASGQLNIRNN